MLQNMRDIDVQKNLHRDQCRQSCWEPRKAMLQGSSHGVNAVRVMDTPWQLTHLDIVIRSKDRGFAGGGWPQGRGADDAKHGDQAAEANRYPPVPATPSLYLSLFPKPISPTKGFIHSM